VRERRRPLQGIRRLLIEGGDFKFHPPLEGLEANEDADAVEIVPHLCSLLRRCWHRDPDARPPAAEVWRTSARRAHVEHSLCVHCACLARFSTV
jgi:hypothetical protein